MKEFFSDVTTSTAIAGAAGGVVRWFTTREKMWPDGLINVVVGAICAVYLTPIVVPVIEPVVGKIVASPDQISGLSGVVIGIGGLSVSGFIMDLWRTRTARLTANKDSEGK